MIMKALLIEDEIDAQNVILKLFEGLVGVIQIVSVENEYSKGLQAVEQLQPDVLFVDINLNGRSGIELVKEIRSKKIKQPYVVFTTAYDSYVLEALRLESFDYLTKPIFREDLETCINRLVSKVQDSPHILVNTHEGIFRIELDKLIYLKADGPYTTLVSEDGKLISSKSLGFYEKLLEEYTQFFRCHKSAIINTAKIKTVNVGNGVVELIKENEVAFSRTYKNELLIRIKFR